MLPFAFAASVFQRVWPWHIPAEYGACYVCALNARPIPTAPALEVAPRPVSTPVADAVSWLARTGLLTARQAGRAGDLAGFAAVAV
jgi:hypothetical protein